MARETLLTDNLVIIARRNIRDRNRDGAVKEGEVASERLGEPARALQEAVRRAQSEHAVRVRDLRRWVFCRPS